MSMHKCHKKTNKRLIGALVMFCLLVLTGCSLNDEPLPPQTNNADFIQSDISSSSNAISKVRMKTPITDKLEAISAVSYDGTHVKANVISFGCTDSTDFTINHEIVDGRCSATIERTKPDMCRRAPMLAEIEVEWTTPVDCVDLELVIVNPVLVTASNGRISKRSK